MSTSDYYILDHSEMEDRKLEAARGLYQKGDYSAALRLYLDMVNTSYSYKLYYEIGRCYYKLNNFDHAEANFLRSIYLESRKNPSHLFLGNIYFKKNNTEKAIENWITSFSFKPDDENVCLNLATSYFSKDMRFQSIIFYNRFLKYSKDKTSAYYTEIKKSMNDFVSTGNECYQKALKAVNLKDIDTAIKGLIVAAKNFPTNFDINYLLGKLYFEKEEYMPAMIFLKQAYCIDNKSLDVLERLSTALIHLGDYTAGYCCLKRIIPLVLNNQKEYLEIIKTVQQLESQFDKMSYQGHLDWAEKYYNENNYHLALFEYENCLIMNNNLSQDLQDKIEKIRTFINPEDRIIKACLEKGATYYSAGDYRESNKYFSKAMLLSSENTSEYKIAKSRLINV